MILIFRCLDRLTQAANIIGTLLIVALVSLICVDVFGRNLFDKPLSGVPEIISLSIVAIVFLQVPQAFRAGRLTRSDGLINTLHNTRPRLASLIEIIFELLSFLVTATLLYAHWPMLIRAIKRQEFIGAIGDITIPVWPAKLMILIGGSLLALQFLCQILRRIRADKTP